MFYFSSHYIPPQFSANGETSERWQFFGGKDLHFKTAKGLTRETLRLYMYHMYIHISVETKMKMIMSKSSISSCGGCSFFVPKIISYLLLGQLIYTFRRFVGSGNGVYSMFETGVINNVQCTNKNRDQRLGSINTSKQQNSSRHTVDG